MSKLWWVLDVLCLAGAATMLTLGSLNNGWQQTYQNNNGNVWLFGLGISTAIVGAFFFCYLAVETWGKK